MSRHIALTAGWCRLAAAFAVALLTAAALSGAAAAHGGSARVVVEPDRIQPGGIVTIRGEDLGADDALRIAIVGSASRTELATVTSDGEGHFTLVVQVPADAPAGVYAVEAAGSAGSAMTAVLFVEGSPIDAGGGALPGQDEGLPAIGASPHASAVAAPGIGLVPIVVSVGEPTDGVDPVPIIALIGAVLALAILFVRTRRPRGSPVESADLS